MKKIIITKNNSGGRLDKFLIQGFFLNSGISRGEVIRNIKSGKILVNNKIAKPSYILRDKDIIEMNIPEKAAELIPNKKIKLAIIFEDKNIIVINKPAGITVHPVSFDETETLANGLIYKFPEIINVGEDPLRPGIVHRLDRDTSGVMVIARNQKTFEELKDKFKNREVSKKYLALVWGHINPKKGIIEKPIARSADYKKQVVTSRKTRTKIRPAVTEYKVLKNYSDYDLIEVSPKTGRMHQIRVHMTFIGHPILGDKKYKLKGISDFSGAKRQMLHAKSLEFELFGKRYSLKSEIPEDFKKISAGLTSRQ